MRTAFVRTLVELARGDSRVWLLSGDLGFSVLEVFAAEFPGRFLNVGVAEQNMTGIAAGLAHRGRIPFTYSIANFPTMRCLEQIRNDVCYHGLPVRIVSVGAGWAYGTQGYTHHGLEDLAVMRALPGMTVVAPADPIETEQLLRQSVDLPGPAYFRLGKAGEPTVHAEGDQVVLGRASQLREGRDVTLIAVGGICRYVLDMAASMAAQDGIDARVVSMHTIKPLDRDAVRSACVETGGVVTIEEHSVTGGLGSAVAEVIAEEGLGRVPFHRVGAPDRVSSLIGDQAFLRLKLFDDLREVVIGMIQGRDAKPQRSEW